ncbi:hypothetical protein FRC17_005444, partial [Serendipita sp. 399]
FQEAAKVVKGLCDGSIELKQTSIDAAQSSLVYALARRVSSPGKAALTSFVNQALKGVSQTWEQDVLAKLKAVTPSEVIEAMRRYVLPIFDPTSSISVVACAPGKVDDIATGLTSEGYEVEKRTLDVGADELEDEESGNPFSDPPTILISPARGRSDSGHNQPSKMEPEIQEIRIVEPRSKPSRSAAAGGAAPPVPPKKRSSSQDGVLQAAAQAEKARAAKTGQKPNKKAGLHVDVIDRLDWSGVGPATFHHDGPFDACAPSRNRHRTKAPMLAWTGSQDMDAGKKKALADTTAEPHADPLVTQLGGMGLNDGPYGAANNYKPKEPKKKTSDPYEFPRRPASPKRRDTLADAWGKGEPEPYEEFFAESVSPAAVGHGEAGLASAASSLYKDKEGHSSSKSGRRPNGGVRRPTNRPPPPPPQPIFPTESTADDDVVLSGDMAYSSSGGNAPRRSKSLMQRFKKMRDSPNVPVDYDDTPTNDQSGSSSENHNGATTRPTHRTQNSVLGRPGNKSPTSPGFNGISVGDTTGEKALPGVPPSASPRDELGGYFDRGLGRKTSIMQKVRGVVVGKK